MASGALFGNAGARTQSKNLLEIKAGKMTLRGKMVHPDKRKGLIYVHQAEDSLMHFCWKDRQKGTVEDDLIIFPDDVEYKAVPQCTTGRVYLLKFKSNNKNMFFWMQDPKTDKDEENCRKLNDLLNNPPAPGTSGAGSLSNLPADLAGLGGETDLHNILGSMNQQQLMQLISGMGGMRGMSSLMDGSSTSSLLSDTTLPSRVHSAQAQSTSRSASSTADIQPERPSTSAGMSTQATASQRPPTTQAEPPQRIRMEDLQNILSGFGSMEPSASSEVDLTQSLNSEAIIPILANPEVQRRLLPYLPEGEELPKSEEELRQTLHSPQFQQALQGFSAALASCQLGPLMAQFGLNDDAVQAAVSGDVLAFARALQKSAKTGDGSSEQTKMDEDKQ